MNFQCGKQFLERGVFMEKLPAMHNSYERIGYAKDCIEVYRKYYPEILEELQGFVDAQGIDFEQVAAFIFGMYAYSVDVHCTCVATKQKDQILLGRNSDFLIAIEEMCLHLDAVGENGSSFTGNSTAFIQMEDGVNEKGLAVGLTFVYPIIKRAGFNAGILVRYLLEKCVRVPEAIQVLQGLPIGSAQTLTLVDAEGNMAVVECNCMEMEVLHSKESESFIVATNEFHSERMRKYQCAFLEDDLYSAKRYANAYSALHDSTTYDLRFMRNLLSGRFGFICQYDRSLGADTVWSTMYDITNRQTYLCEGNPSRVPFIKQGDRYDGRDMEV